MAADGDRRGLLIPLDLEPDDSGIDSDDAERGRTGRRQGSDESPRDDGAVIKPPWVRAVKKKNDKLLKAMEDGLLETPEEIMESWENRPPHRDSLSDGEDSLDRSSPPLYEVELTASDEDDDGSVLELVIPMQHSSRYQRVPTASPKKGKLQKPGFLITLFCCVRK